MMVSNCSLNISRNVSYLDRVINELLSPGIPNALVERAKALKLIKDELGVRRLRIGVIGITSSGKSTFLNGLLGERLLPEQSIPTSNVLTFIRKGKRQMTIHYLNGQKEVFTGENLDSSVLLRFTSESNNPENRRNVQKVVLEHPDIPFPEEFELWELLG